MITLLEKHSNVANEVYEFIADSKSDLTNFETDVKTLLHGKMCGTHSKCFVIETGTWFYYGADGTLTEAAESGGGTGYSQLTGLYFNSQNDSVTYSDGIAVFVGQFQLTTADGNSTFANGSVTLPIVAGAGIKIDASKDGRSLIIKAASTEYVISGSYGHCENNNPAAVADEGTAYVATITANSGYNFGTGYTLTVTMGGTDITSEVAVVSTDTISINIPSVTGNIDINCIAVEIPTKLATPTIAMNADGKTLEITDVANAQRYKIYANGELKTTITKAG